MTMDEIGGTGPRPIPAGQGRKYLQRVEPFYQVSLDAAGFDWLWRIVENRHGQHTQQVRGDGDVHDLQAQVSRRVVIAFREAAGTYVAPATAVKKTRRLVRTPKKG